MMDERNDRIIASAMGLTLGLLYVALIGWCVYKYISTKDITNCTIEIIFIVLIPVAIGRFARKDESLTLPRNISGDILSPDDDPASKNIRKRHYFWDAFGFATFILVCDLIGRFAFKIDVDLPLLFNKLSETMNIIAT